MLEKEKKKKNYGTYVNSSPKSCKQNICSPHNHANVMLASNTLGLNPTRLEYPIPNS